MDEHKATRLTCDPHPSIEEAIRLHRAGRLNEAVDQYGRVLAADPSHFDARYYLCAILLQQGRPQAALRETQLLLATGAKRARIQKLASAVLRALGRNEEALAALDNAIGIDPNGADLYGSRGDLLMDMRRAAEAVESYNAALRLQPDSFGDLINQAAALNSLGRHEEAVTSYDRALALQPDSAMGYASRGTSYAKLGRRPTATADFAKALALDPLNPEIYYQFANALAIAGDHNAAIKQFHQALARKPDHIGAKLGLAKEFLELDRPDEALLHGRQALSAQPDNEMAARHVVTALTGLDRAEEGIDICKQALLQHPDSAGLDWALANAYRRLGQYDLALKAYEKARARESNEAPLHCDIGMTLASMDRVEDAEAAYEQALSVDPAHVPTLYNKAMLRLSRARFDGYVLYESRFDLPGESRRAYEQPRWDGGPVNGALLVVAEQGLGDHIIYAGLLDELKRVASSVVVEVEPRLVPLFKRSLNGIDVVPVTPNLYSGNVAAQVPMASLPRYLRRDLRSFPKRDRGYLVADPERVRHLRQRLATDGRPVIGLAWISRNPKIGSLKSAALHDFAPLLRAGNLRFVDLQYGNTTQERADIQSELGIAVERFVDIDNQNDIDGLAALICACDAVVTVSNTTTHLAGALGVPTWVLVQRGHASIWYWFRGITDSPWYPSVSVHVRAAEQSWSKLVGSIVPQIQESLAKLRI